MTPSACHGLTPHTLSLTLCPGGGGEESWKGKNEKTCGLIRHELSGTEESKRRGKLELPFQVTKTSCTSYVVRSAWKWEFSFRFSCSLGRSSLLPTYVKKERPGANLSLREKEKTVSQAKSFHVFMTLEPIIKHSHCRDNENSDPKTLHSWEMCLDLSFWISLLHDFPLRLALQLLALVWTSPK